jgi:heme a synthase
VVGFLALACLALTLLPGQRSRRRTIRAALVLAGIPAQAVMGEFVVRSHLNPWLVAGHFLISIAVIALAFLCWMSTAEPAGPRRALVARPLRALSWLLAVVSGAVIVAGTVVTGSGPHAGDAHARRTGLDPAVVAQLHTDLVMLLIGLSVALWFGLRAAGSPPPVRIRGGAGFARTTPTRAAAVLIGIELAQAVIGFTQYFTHLPAVLVGIHMAGACAVWLGVLNALRAQRSPVHPAQPGPVPAQEAVLAAPTT